MGAEVPIGRQTWTRPANGRTRQCRQYREMGGASVSDDLQRIHHRARALSPRRDGPDGGLARPHRPHHQLGDHRRGGNALAVAVVAVHRITACSCSPCVLVQLLLLIEARRYRFFDVYRGRVRRLEKNYFAQILICADCGPSTAGRNPRPGFAQAAFPDPAVCGDVAAAEAKLHLDVSHSSARMGAQDLDAQAAGGRHRARTGLVCPTKSSATQHSGRYPAGSSCSAWLAFYCWLAYAVLRPDVETVEALRRGSRLRGGGTGLKPASASAACSASRP